jgi:hypothetical protein
MESAQKYAKTVYRQKFLLQELRKKALPELDFMKEAEETGEL